MGQPKSKRTDEPPARASQRSAASQSSTGLAVIEQLLELMNEHELAELAFEQGDLKIALKKAGANVAAVPAPVAYAPVAAAPVPIATEPDAAAAPQADDAAHEIVSPMVGTFYAGSDPESAHFMEVGARVTPETVVCIIEAMKVMNEIKAECSGTVVRVLVANGQAVEFGQPLFAVEPD